MRKWINLFEAPLSSGLAAVTSHEVATYYGSGQMDLSGLIDAYQSVGNDLTAHDYSGEVAEMKRILSPIANGPLKLYRCLRGKPDISHLGIHWSLWEELSGDYGLTQMTAIVSSENVDWLGTIARGIHWWNEEQEITLLPGKPVMVTIKDLGGIDLPIGPIRART